MPDRRFASADEQTAKVAQGYVDRQLAAIASGGMLAIALPGLAVTRTGPLVKVGGQIPTGLLASLREQLVKAMP